MTQKSGVSGKSAWGTQLARICCGELAGTEQPQPRAEYVEDTHHMRFHGGVGEQPIDLPLDHDEPSNLDAHAKELVARYERHVETNPHPRADDSTSR